MSTKSAEARRAYDKARYARTKEHRATLRRVRDAKNRKKLNERMRLYRRKNLRRMREAANTRYAKGRHGILAQRRAWRARHPDKVRIQNKNFRLRHPEKAKATDSASYRKRREKILAQKKEYQRRTRDERNAYQRQRNLTDIQFHLAKRLRGRIGIALRRSGARKSHKTVALLGCTVTKAKQHLESHFLPGMSWQNRALWHIDHRIPCAAFDLTDPAQQKTCFHFTNLQPLWKRDNLSKGAKLPHELVAA